MKLQMNLTTIWSLDLFSAHLFQAGLDPLSLQIAPCFPGSPFCPESPCFPLLDLVLLVFCPANLTYHAEVRSTRLQPYNRPAIYIYHARDPQNELPAMITSYGPTRYLIGRALIASCAISAIIASYLPYEIWLAEFRISRHFHGIWLAERWLPIAQFL